jgi:FkbM family methyltransferase
MPRYHAEDEVDRVVRERFFPDYSYRGTFVEVGAASPEYLSMSRHFREAGWRVVAIEPNPYFCELHRRAGQTIHEYAAGNEDRDDVEFQVVHCPGEYKGGTVTYESFSALEVKDSYRRLCQGTNLNYHTIRVKLRKLETILREHHPDLRRIDVLSIDVEGWELEVLAGAALDYRQPRVVVVENVFDDPAYERAGGTHDQGAVHYQSGSAMRRS